MMRLWLVVYCNLIGFVALQVHARPNVFDKFKQHVTVAKEAIEGIVNKPDLEILGDQFEELNCIRTPEEYFRAFQAREPRCVSRDLIGRVSQGATVANSAFNGTVKAAFFFTSSDGLAKYLRIGFPSTLGDYVPDTVSYDDPQFPGLTNAETGQALLEALGYGVAEIAINNVYILNIFSRTALKVALQSFQNSRAFPFNANVDGVVPTWRNVRDYFVYTFSDVPLVISNDVVSILEQNDFDTLTGCPAQCTYSDASFPSTGHTRLAYTQARTASGTCPDPRGPGDLLIAPTSFEASSQLCSSGWASKYQTMFTFFSPFFPTPGCTPSNELGSAQLLAQKLASTSDPMEQALWFRAYLIQGCNGNFNPLFSGNGYTYTGTGGLLAGLSTELIVSPFLVELLPDNKLVPIAFCVNGLNGGQPTPPGPNGTCSLPS